MGWVQFESCVPLLSCPFCVCAALIPCSNGWVLRGHNILKFGVLLQCLSVKGTDCILSNNKTSRASKDQAAKFFPTELLLLTIKTEHYLQTMFCLTVLTLIRLYNVLSYSVHSLWLSEQRHQMCTKGVVGWSEQTLDRELHFNQSEEIRLHVEICLIQFLLTATMD